MPKKKQPKVGKLTARECDKIAQKAQGMVDGISYDVKERPSIHLRFQCKNLADTAKRVSAMLKEEAGKPDSKDKPHPGGVGQSRVQAKVDSNVRQAEARSGSASGVNTHAGRV